MKIKHSKAKKNRKNHKVGPKREPCLYACGNTVQSPLVICKECRRASRRRIAKLEYKQKRKSDHEEK